MLVKLDPEKINKQTKNPQHMRDPETATDKWELQKPSEGRDCTVLDKVLWEQQKNDLGQGASQVKPEDGMDAGKVMESHDRVPESLNHFCFVS
jgi:hypothetical protein